MSNKKVFTVKVDDKDIELAVVKPSYEVQHKSALVRSKMFASAIKNGAILRSELDDEMKKRNLWNTEKQKQLEELNEKINTLTMRLQKGGIKLSDGRQLALDIKRARGERNQLLSDRVALDGSTAEGQSENEALSYIVSRCIINNEDGNPHYKTYEDYLENRSSEISRRGFELYVELISDINVNFENSLPENKFLQTYKFIDEKGRFINKEGHYVDIDGKLIDEDGNFINEKGEKIDRNGNRVDENGNYIVESQPFLDDDGNPIV